MTLSEFNILSFDAKASLLSKYGRYLEQKKGECGSRIAIYDLFGFYVEVSFRFDRRVQYMRAMDHVMEGRGRIDNISMLHLN